LLAAGQALIQFSRTQAQQIIKADFMVSDITGYLVTSPQLSVSQIGNMVVAWETVGSGGIWVKMVSSGEGQPVR